MPAHLATAKAPSSRRANGRPRAILAVVASMVAAILVVMSSLVYDGLAAMTGPWGPPAGQALATVALLLVGYLLHDAFYRRRLADEMLRRATEEQSARMLAMYDPLTGLLNRRGMADVTQRLHGDGRNHALLLCDLDGFKRINDMHGHRAGDDVLRAFGQRLAALRRDGVDIAPIRLGGDEFVLLLSTENDDFEAAMVARDVLRLMADPFPARDRTLILAASIGVAQAAAGEPIEDLLERADEAMYEAKRNGLPLRVARRDVRQPDESTRRMFERQIDTRSPDRALFAAAIGINRLHQMRCALGYGLGSKLIREITQRLAMLEEDFGFERLSSDVLGVAFKASDRAAAAAVIEKVRALVEATVTLAGTAVDVRLTVGLAGPGDVATVRDLTEQAQAALEQAWREGSPLAMFDEVQQAAASENISLMADMRVAVSAGDIDIHYQPKMRARSGEIEGMEALVRWTHPTMGPVSPARFIPVAEKTGDIRALTEYVIARVIDDRRELVKRGHAQTIYVNVSAELVGDEGFASHLLRSIDGLDGGIGIEITETAVLSNPDRALAHLNQLAEAGIKIAIDDYGAGLSSLAYLKQLPATELKLDMMFVTNLATSHRDPMIVRSTIELAHGLGLLVTAEGVESQDALALLRVMGCDLLQGYLIAKPMPLAALARFLDCHRPSDVEHHSRCFADMFNQQLPRVA